MHYFIFTQGVAEYYFVLLEDLRCQPEIVLRDAQTDLKLTSLCFYTFGDV